MDAVSPETGGRSQIPDVSASTQEIAEADSPDRFAGNTLSSKAPQEERRLVTALFCDLVGFTPLSEQLDPEEVRDIQSEYFEAMRLQIERYGGTIEKYAGDAVLALFGVPSAHEDDAERAVLCALGMQEGIQSVAEKARARWNAEPAIRVGVNTGEVVSGVWEAGGRQDVAVTGDAVNTAARIQTMAEPGEVLVGAETMHLTRRRIAYGEKRNLVLKGKTGTIPAFPALGLREEYQERWEEASRISPLVGRDREMVQMLDAWMRAQGGEGQLLTLVGDAGVGKSRLVAELVEKISTASTIRVIRGRCLSYGQGISLWLLADVLRGLLGVTEQETLDEIRPKLHFGVATLLAQSDPQTQSEALDVLGEVLGLAVGDSAVAKAGAQIRRQTLVRSLRLLLSAISERAPTIFVFEDLNWIDQASEEVLKEILSIVPGLRLLILSTHRPGWVAPWSEWGWTERLTLRPLREEDAALLAGAVLGGMRLSAELERYVGERAGGNPFFVEEMLRALEETGSLEEREGQMYLVAGAAEKLPPTLTEVLLARLDRLEAQVRNVAQVASVIGRSFAVRLLAQVMEREQAALEMPLTALQNAEIAFPGGGSDLEYVFKHVSMQEVAYNTLVQKRRQALHLATARAIASLYPAEEYVEMIAHHYRHTDDCREALEWLERAGDRAAGVYANETAIRNYEEAKKRSQLAESAPTQIGRLNEKLGAVLHTVARFGEALDVLDQAVEAYQQARDMEAVGRVTATIGRVHRDQGTVAEGIARLQPLVDMLALGGPSRGLASLQVALSHLFFAGGRYEEGLKAAERASETAKAVDDVALLAAAEMRRGTLAGYFGGREEGIAILESSVALAESAGDLVTLNIALANLATLYQDVGMLEQARTSLERAFELAERVGELASMGHTQVNIGELLYYTGEWDEARRHVDMGADIIRSVGSSWYSAYPPLLIGRLQISQGEWEEAARSLHECLSISEPIGDTQAIWQAAMGLGELEILGGSPERAWARLEGIALESDLIDGVRLLWIIAWSQLEMGRLDQADQTISGAIKMGEAKSSRIPLPDALRIQAMIRMRQERWDDARATLDDAISLARSLPYPYAEARAIHERALMALKQGDSVHAREQLLEALEIFRRLGAMKDVARAEESLLQLDATPTRG